MRSHKWFAIIPIALLTVLGLALPAGSGAAFTTCAQETTSVPGPYALQWRVLPNLRTVQVKGSVGGRFSGVCLGFLTGKVTVIVTRHGQVQERKSRRFTNQRQLEFRNGLYDQGRPFPIHFVKKFTRLQAGDCVRASATWNWRFQNDEAVPKGHASVHAGSGCVRSN